MNNNGGKKEHEETCLIEVSHNILERLPVFMAMNTIVSKVLVGAGGVGQKLGDALIMCIQFLVIEARRKGEELPTCKMCGEEATIGALGLCLYCENEMQQAEVDNDPNLVIDDDDGYAD